MFSPRCLLDLVRNFVAFYGDGEQVVKKMAQYHQYWAVCKAVVSHVEAVEGDGRAGVVWHTQGSGKCSRCCFYAGKVDARSGDGESDPRVLTDRNDLDDQLFDDTFAAAKIGAPLPELPVQAESREELRRLLQACQSGGIMFTTIQKFGLSKDEKDAGRGSRRCRTAATSS